MLMVRSAQSCEAELAEEVEKTRASPGTAPNCECAGILPAMSYTNDIVRNCDLVNALST